VRFSTPCFNKSYLGTVKMGNFVTFFAQTIFFTKFREGIPYVFPGRKFIKNGYFAKETSKS
jgi:hypothetical protein